MTADDGKHTFNLERSMPSWSSWLVSDWAVHYRIDVHCALCSHLVSFLSIISKCHSVYRPPIMPHAIVMARSLTCGLWRQGPVSGQLNTLINEWIGMNRDANRTFTQHLYSRARLIYSYLAIYINIDSRAVWLLHCYTVLGYWTQDYKPRPPIWQLEAIVM